jgi:hypothetical protein
LGAGVKVRNVLSVTVAYILGYTGLFQVLLNEKAIKIAQQLFLTVIIRTGKPPQVNEGRDRCG